jgi:hypothetical protein
VLRVTNLWSEWYSIKGVVRDFQPSQTVELSPLHHFSADAYGRDQRRSSGRPLVFGRHLHGMCGVRCVHDDAQPNTSSCVPLGLHIALAIACVRAIRRSTAFADYPRRAHAAIAYVVVLFTVATLNIGTKSAEWVTMFVDNRSSPLGPAQSLVRIERGALMPLTMAYF